MATYKYNDGSKTDYWVKKMIPVLVRWAQSSWDKTHYYSDLAEAVGYKSNQIGHFLGCVDDAIHELGEDIPTLNALVVNKKDGIPSYGFDYVSKEYGSFTDEDKKAFAHAANKKAHEYDWSGVLDKLGLKPALLLPLEEVSSIRQKIKTAKGGEGSAHKALKEYVAQHPERLGIEGVENAETEHCLLSGDRLDVYFETDKEVYAIEVKSKISDEDDIRRGIFQCVKYQAVLEAERIFAHQDKRVFTILVMENELSAMCKQVVADLDIDVEENFSY